MQEYLRLLPLQQLSASFVHIHWLFLRFRFFYYFWTSSFPHKAIKWLKWADDHCVHGLSAVRTWSTYCSSSFSIFQYFIIWKSVNIYIEFIPNIVQTKLTSTLSLTSIPPSLSSSSCLWMCRRASRLKRSASPRHGGITMRQGSTAGTPTQEKRNGMSVTTTQLDCLCQKHHDAEQMKPQLSTQHLSSFHVLLAISSVSASNINEHVTFKINGAERYRQPFSVAFWCRLCYSCHLAVHRRSKTRHVTGHVPGLSLNEKTAGRMSVSTEESSVGRGLRLDWAPRRCRASGWITLGPFVFV